MTLLCPCGRRFVSRVIDDEISVLCPGCTLVHDQGRGDAAPCWSATYEQPIGFNVIRFPDQEAS